MNNRKNILCLFTTFLKIGAFTFGGGYAMIPIIQKEVGDNKKWLDNDDILDIIAISESTPGPISINAATFIGYRVAGFWGAFCATAGTVLPSFAIIAVISLLLERFQEFKHIKYAFFGIRAGVVALVIKGLITMYKQCTKKIFSYLIMGLSFILSLFFDIEIPLILLLCAVFGIIFYTKFEDGARK